MQDSVQHMDKSKKVDSLEHEQMRARRPNVQGRLKRDTDNKVLAGVLAGIADFTVGQVSLTTFEYPEGEWFNVKHVIDLDENTLTYFINDENILKIQPSIHLKTHSPILLNQMIIIII